MPFYTNLACFYRNSGQLKLAIETNLFIISKNKSDFKWAEQQRVGVSEKCKLYLQPEWSNKEDMVQLIIDYVMKNPEWKISLQTHKYLQIP